MPNLSRVCKRNSGFTLIELMIVLVVIAILAAIAYPSYQNHVLRTRRASAAACLQELALQMERRYATNMAYNPPNTLPTVSCTNDLAGFYNFGFANIASTAYTLRAVPTGPQTKDTQCGTLTLDHLGTKGKTGPASVAECWR
ncbi:MAG: type IV pilin protein [Rhodocyclaceae bacterium]